MKFINNLKLTALIQQSAAKLDGYDLEEFLDSICDYRYAVTIEDYHSDGDMRDAFEESVEGGFRLGMQVAKTGQKLYAATVDDEPTIHTLYILAKNVKEAIARVENTLKLYEVSEVMDT